MRRFCRGLMGSLALFVAALVLQAAVLSGSARAATPAGTVIGNQATATYLDASGTTRTSTSNLVQTTVSQVKSFTLTANGAKQGTPGQTVYYPHTITNTGNGTDTYALGTLVAGGTVTQTGLTYYVDGNGDGIPDNFTPISSSGALAAGTQFSFVVAATIPAAATAGQTGTVTVPVTDTGSNAASNTDTTTVANSVVNVTKALSVSSGPSPFAAAITVTLSYSNAGTSAATNMVLSDALPAGMTYVAGSGRWSTSGTTAMTDAAAGDPTGIAYDYGATAATTVTATIASVAAGTSGNVTFQVTIATGLAPTTPSNQALTTNTATFKSDQQTTATNSNSAVYRVVQVASLTATGQTIASAAQGATVSFSNVITNTGNGTDSFDITYPAVGAGGNTFPAGTTFGLFQSDGATSLLDSNGNGTPDTGLLAPGASFTVVLKATLPTGATGGPFAVTKTATSKFDNTKTATAADTLTAISNNTVDLTENTARTDSTPAGTATAGNAATTGFGNGTATAIATNTVTPSASAITTTAFRLVVNNTSGVADSFDLATTSTLPTGYTVTFYSDGGGGACATLGGALTNSGSLAAGTNRLVCAVVSVPWTASGNAPAVTNNFTFRAQSPVTPSSTDSIVDAVTVNALHNLTITPNGMQSTFAGGAVLYTHVLRNTGNVAETVTFPSGYLADTQASASWTSAAYLDSNANGTYDAGTDALVTPSTTLSLAANATQTVFVRVFAPASATATSPADVTTLTATYNSTGTASATDTTSVSNGLSLTKAQIAGTCGTALASGPFSTAAIASGVNTAPGKCIAYQVTASNTTAGSITNVAVSDIIPSNTTLAVSSCFASTATAGATISGSATTEGATGTVVATAATLAPSGTFSVTFCVRINP